MTEGTAAEDELSFGIRVQSAQDVAQLRWLLAHADARLVRLTAAGMATRLAPRPQQVIAELGLERRSRPRGDALPARRPSPQSLHAHAREQGWRRA